MISTVNANNMADGQDQACAPQAQASLKPMLVITWKKGPSLPQGFQDSDGGIVNNTLITVGGFCKGRTGVPGKAGKYPRGFLEKVWGLDLEAPQKGWQSLPDFPGAARQELLAIVIDDQLYCWGGFSYSAPYSYKDGYRLSYNQDKWTWEPLPELPWLMSAGGICAIGSRVYVMGGGDYDYNKSYTNADRAGRVERLGARLLVIDTKKRKAGWKELSPCPGTARGAHATAAVDGKVYVLGGATGSDNSTGSGCTVVDNWRYDPATDKWQRLCDLPVASGNFPSGQIVYDNRYILLVGGYQYKYVLNPDGTARQPYGKPFKTYPDKDYYSDVFVYDTKTNTFGTATPLPLNNNLPMTVVAGDRIHLIGGEIRYAVIEGEHFGHHPDLYLMGTIRKVGL